MLLHRWRQLRSRVGLRGRHAIFSRETNRPLRHPIQSLRDGLRTCFGFPPIRALILLIATMSFRRQIVTVSSRLNLPPMFLAERPARFGG